jgi:hypothetical protein
MLNKDELWNGAFEEAERPEGLYVQRSMSIGDRVLLAVIVGMFMTLLVMAMQSDYFWQMITGNL